MCYTGLIKRIIPFALTFAVGLFVASFFVTIASPWAGWRNNRRVNRFHEMQQLRVENDALRETCRELRTQNEELRRSMSDSEMELIMPEVAPPMDFDEHHPPPPPPKRPKNPRFE